MSKLIPLVATYALLAWWAVASIVPIHAWPAHPPNAAKNCAIFNFVLVLIVALLWAHALFGRRK